MTARAYTSGSGLPLVMKCGPAGVLPRVQRTSEKDRVGSALHEHMADRPVLGIAGAMERLQTIADHWELDERESGIFMARARGFEWSPPRASVCERALCLVDDGTVVEVEGGRGVYRKLPPGALLPTQIDVMWAEPDPLYLDADGRVRCPPTSILWVGDYKSGLESYVDAVERNGQVLAGCVLAAKWTGAVAALPAIIYIRKGRGLWDVPEHYLTKEGLDYAETAIRAVLANVEDQRRRLVAGEPLTYVEGPHCTYCDSRIYCAAKVGTLKAYLDDPQPLTPAGLTDRQTVKLAEMLPQIEAFAKSAREALRARVDALGQPVVLSNGKLWGPNPHETAVVDPAIAVQVLAEELGDPEAAAAVLKAEVSKAAIKEAISAAHEKKGIKRQGAAVMRRVLGKIASLGGIRTEVSTWYSMFAGELPPEPAPAGAPQLTNGPPSTRPTPYSGEEIDGDD